MCLYKSNCYLKMNYLGAILPENKVDNLFGLFQFILIFALLKREKGQIP